MFPTISRQDIPSVTTDQMIEVDRLMIDVYEIDLTRMMENAGRTLAQLARKRFLGGDAAGKAVTVLAGSGGNGGGALVAARRLAAWGARVEVVLAQSPDALTPVPAIQLAILQRMGLAVREDEPTTGGGDLVIDGVIGYSLTGSPRGGAKALITWANAAGAAVLSLDTPSGLDTGSGVAHDPTVRAAATLTLALPKTGLLGGGAAEWIGELYCGDISVPPRLYAEPTLGLTVPPFFSQSDIVRIV